MIEGRNRGKERIKKMYTERKWREEWVRERRKG